jgi:TolB-like protein/Flp pilus assembly protein TadD/predicted Ser/Thr protein kinase
MISRYRVVRRLGAGGMGEVLLAEDTALERFVALKLMSSELAKDENQRKRFRSEAKAASALNHSNICVIYEVGETDDGQPFLAMEYIEGQTLDVLLRQRRFAIREVLPVGIQIAEALDAAHSRRIVHRDIKPGNIMLDRRGQAKVLDFGLAKRLEQDQASDTTFLSSALTKTGVLIGTPYYMSPEQVLGRKLDHRSDIFSLGVVLYELIAGQKPFLGKTVGETTNSIVNQRPGSLGITDPVLSAALDKIIFKCLEKDPENRYGAAKELATELGQVQRELEGASVANAREKTLVLATAQPGMGTPPPTAPDPGGREQTKLWQLAGKASEPGYGSQIVLTWFIILLAATALGFYLVDNRAGRIAFSVVDVVLVGLVGYWWVSRRPRPDSGQSRQPGIEMAGPRGPAVADAAAQEKSLAVLPFANFSAEKDSDYLSDGLTDEITSALSRLPGLKVAARNSAFAFKGRHEDARKIGDALRVTMLLEGSVRKSGPQIRVTAQLVNVADGYHLWSESFDRDVSNVIAVQDEIARQIAERLRMEIGADTSAAMRQRRAINPQAHELYLQARHFWNKRTRADIEQAVQLFGKAIDADPAYADAHAALGASYVLLPGYAYRPASEYLPLARSAATRALELDPTSAEAHTVLGDAATQLGDFDTAIPHFRRVIELNPNYATGRHWYGAALQEIGLMDEALVEYRKAEELDPLSPVIRACIPEWYYLTGQNEDAIVETEKALQIFPEFSALRKFLALALIRKGMYREALEHITRDRANNPGAPARLDLLAFCEARLGNEAEARKILAELEDFQKRGYDMSEEIGWALLGLRQYDQAVDAFERFCVSGILCRSTVRNPLLMDELRDHPRFQALLRKLEVNTAPFTNKTQSAGPPSQPATTRFKPAETRTKPLANPALIIGAVLLAGLVIFGGWYLFHFGSSSRRSSATGFPASLAQQKSVAVLPFENFSDEKDTDYLSDGLTEEITSLLSRQPGLKVVGRNSAFRFRGPRTDLRKAGAALGVATLLTGTLHKFGPQVQVTAQLVNAIDGVRLWSKSYNRSPEDIAAVQEDIAREITELFQGQLSPLKRQAVAPEAHKLYLQGLVFWNKRTQPGLRKAIDLFNEAIEKDPTYASAHAALASAYMLLPQYSDGLRLSQYRPLARASANRALDLDPDCAEAHAVLAMLYNYDRDHKRSEAHFQRAILLDPNYATVHHWYGICLEIIGRREQGLAELQKALDLDPLSPIIHTTIPEWHYFGKDYDGAIAEARKVIDTFPDFPAARVQLILPLMMKGQLTDALAQIDEARGLQPDHPLELLHLKGYCLARLGREDEARKILADLEQLQLQQNKSLEHFIAFIYQGLREYDKEFEWAERMRVTEGLQEEVMVDPMMDEVRSLPQFQALLQRAGLTNSVAP